VSRWSTNGASLKQYCLTHHGFQIHKQFCKVHCADTRFFDAQKEASKAATLHVKTRPAAHGAGQRCTHRHLLPPPPAQSQHCRTQSGPTLHTPTPSTNPPHRASTAAHRASQRSSTLLTAAHGGLGGGVITSGKATKASRPTNRDLFGLSVNRILVPLAKFQRTKLTRCHHNLKHRIGRGCASKWTFGARPLLQTAKF
jgi:hypothetical protein